MDDSMANDMLATTRDVVLEILPKAWAVYVHGSFAFGDARPDSDLDLAVLMPPGQTLEQPWELAAKLGSRVAENHGSGLV